MAGLTAKQKHEAQLIREILSEAGWELTTRGEAFDAADLEYESDEMELSVEYMWDDQAIFFTAYEVNGSEGIELKIECDGKLEELLRLIVSFQDKINSDTTNDHVSAIVKLCPSTYRSEGDDDLVKLSPDD